MADLNDIPGIAELRDISLGDPGIQIALIDGLPDLDHEAFRGRHVRLLDPSGLKQYEDEHDPSMREHATFVGSVLVGDPACEREGVAPDCSLTFIVAMHEYEDFDTRLAYVRALEAAYETGAQIVHSAIALPSQSGRVDPMVSRAMERLRDAGVLIVSPAGNDHGTAWTFPAIAEYCLAVGNVDDDGRAVDSTNSGDLFSGHGVMANGTRILGALPGGGYGRQRGTSLAAPHVTGVAALLMSILKDRGLEVDPMTVGRAIIASARPCTEVPERCIGGILDPMGALDMLHADRTPAPLSPKSLRVEPLVEDGPGLPPNSPVRFEAPDYPDEGSAMVDGAPRPEPESHAPEDSHRNDARADQSAAELSAASLLPRTPKMAFALGQLGFDIPTDVRRERLVDEIARANLAGAPEDPAVLAALMDRAPSVAGDVTWLVMREASPLYAIETLGSMSAQVLSAFASGIGEQVSGAIEEMSFPGVVTGALAALSTGESVPVLRVNGPRGIYGWRRIDQVMRLPLPQMGRIQLEAMLAAIDDGEPNDGTHSHVRAVNYLVTNPAQLAWSAGIAAEESFIFDSLAVQRSTLNRPYSDVWDIDLLFRDPERPARAKLLHRHSVDVGDALPVSIGQPRTWRVA